MRLHWQLSVQVVGGRVAPDIRLPLELWGIGVLVLLQVFAGRPTQIQPSWKASKPSPTSCRPGLLRGPLQQVDLAVLQASLSRRQHWRDLTGLPSRMRKRWRSRARSGTDMFDDAPSGMPVNLDGEESFHEEFESSSPFGAEQGEGLQHDSAMQLLFGAEADDAIFGGDFGLPFDTPVLEGARDSSVSFVDADGDVRTPEGSFSHVDSVISEAIRLTDKKPVLYPWEKGRMSRIFGDRGRLESKMPRLHASSNSFVKVDVEVRKGLQCTAAIGVRPTRSDDALYSSVVKQVIGGSYVEERDAKRDLAVRAWWDLLRLDMLCSDPGRIAMQEKGLADIYRNGIEILDASLGVKSPNTVMKRLYAAKTYNTWVTRCNGKSWLPVDEQTVWTYFKELKAEKAPATRATSFSEALRFCHFVFRVDGCEEVLASLRVRGLASQHYACKRPWKPADPLPVSDVQLLNRAMLDDRRSTVDRVLIGHLLHMVYARARFSDLLASVNCMLDDECVFLELEAAVHKGSKAMLLPVVAPANWISEGCWAKDEPEPMLPAPKRGGTGWQKRFLTSQEMNGFMKKLFRMVVCHWLGAAFLPIRARPPAFLGAPSMM